MNSLPLNPEIIRPNKPATIIFYEVLPVAEFANCMYWHDIEDKSLISLGSVKISRVYHSTYKGFTDRTCADDFSLVHFSGAFVSASQIVTVVDFEAESYGCAEIPKEEAKDDQRRDSIRVAVGDSFLVKALFSVFCEEARAAEVSCETCDDYVASSIKSHKCFTCGDKHVNWWPINPDRRPEPEHIDDQPKICSTCGMERPQKIKGDKVAPLGCRTCGNFKNWIPK